MTDQNQNNKAPDMSGSLLDDTFARIFYRLARDKKSGILDVYTEPPPSGKILKRLYIKGGNSFYVQGGSVKETLGAIMVMQGKLSKEKYDQLLKEAGGDHGRLEEMLMASCQELGIPPHELGEALTLQTAIKIKLCFGWVKGFYHFKEAPEGEVEKDRMLYELSPEKILLEGVREQFPKERLELEFPGIERKIFRPSNGLKDAISKFSLPPATVRALERLPSEIRFSSAVQQVKIKPEAAAKALLLALYLGGYLTLSDEDENFPLGRAYETAEEKLKDKKPAAAAGKEKTAAPAGKEEPRREAPKPKEEPKLPIEEKLDRKMTDDEIVKEIDQYLDLVSKKDTTYFEIMGVDQSVPPIQIKKIYFKMAKVFHPDARPDLYQGEMRSKVEAVFTKISEAYDYITDNEKRQVYIKQLKSKVSDEELEKANRAITAEMEFQKAEVLLKKGSFQQAKGMLDQIVKLMPDEPDYKIYQAWAMYKTEGPGKAQAAGQMIENALKERGNNKDGWYYLGMINRSEGRTDEAIKNFQKVVELDKYHTEAMRELRVLTMRKEKGPEKERGGRFGRKK